MRLLAFIIALITLLSLFACAKNGSRNPQLTTLDTTITDTTEPQTTEADTTTEETTTEGVTTEPYVPIYEDGGFTYKIDVRNYLTYINPSDSTKYLVIANRKHPLGSSYVPKDLVSISDSNSRQLVYTAKMALEAMCLEMKTLNVYDTNPQSAYRSYSYQRNLYAKYMDRERNKYPHLSDEELMIIVDTYSARPGTSDHQTGLTIDFNPINSSFVNTKAFTYLTKNAHKFGFILRYPKGKEYITGYKYEPWHWRFVGRDAATYIYEHGITLEEYMAEMNETALETFPDVVMPPLDPPETLPDEIEPDITTEDVTTSDEVTTDEVITTGGESTTDDITTDEVTTPVDTTTAEEATTTPSVTTEEVTTTEEATTTEEVTTEAVTTTEAEVTDAEITE